ncbi:MAG: 16S rRNA (cytidine(1402)-2'-O)-methyltransferase [Clostridia bacterium]
MSKLYLVGTPLGNLKDVTLRALETLKMVDVIACEDTRHSLTFLKNYDISKPLMSYHKFNEKECSVKILNMIKEGKNIALITDAGMPCISDPGAILVAEAYKSDVEVEVIPSATAFTSAIALTGIERGGFCFLGFLPEKNKEREALVLPYKNIFVNLVFYCAPHSINKDAKFLYDLLGERKVYAVKEITKIYESCKIMNLQNFEIENPKGEFVLIVEGKECENPLNDQTIEQHLKDYLAVGMDKKEAIKQTAKDRGVPKDEVYKIAIGLK